MSDKTAFPLVRANEANLSPRSVSDGTVPTGVVQPHGLRHIGRVSAPELARAGTDGRHDF